MNKKIKLRDVYYIASARKHIYSYRLFISTLLILNL